jgi:hypothetical protein
MTHKNGIKDEQRPENMQESVEAPVHIIKPLRPFIRVNISLECAGEREENHCNTEPYQNCADPLTLG